MGKRIGAIEALLLRYHTNEGMLGLFLSIIVCHGGVGGIPSGHCLSRSFVLGGVDLFVPMEAIALDCCQIFWVRQRHYQSTRIR